MKKSNIVLGKKLLGFLVASLFLCGIATVVLFFVAILKGGIFWFIDLGLFVVAVVIFFSLGIGTSQYEVERRQKAEAEGKIYCENSDIAKIIKSFAGPHCSLANCPICNGNIEKDKNYFFKKIVKEKENIDGVYITHTYSQGEAQQAWKWVNKEKEFNAEKRFCPNCEWEAYYGEYSGYDSVTSFVRDDEGGGYETREQFCTSHISGFDCGKIWPESYERFKKDKKYMPGIKPENYIYRVEPKDIFYKKD